ncbi:MAG: acyl-CoA dehydrogenase, partial [Betaproteobacteria bacterium]|nr:acyl-CoA dehydrogenase [Betaproteobacteria bacterium]
MTTQFESWIGRKEERTDRAHASVVQAMAATLDHKHVPVA